MLRTTLPKAYIKRTIRPLYGWTQSTPVSGFLDPAWNRTVDIYPGMAMMRTEGENYTLLDGTGRAAGLSALYVGGDGIDEVEDSGVNAFAVWVLGPDAEFEILAPAFDDTQTWTDPGNGTDLLVHAWVTGKDRGKLAPVGSTKAEHTLSSAPVARLVKVNSDSRITVAGLRGTV